MMELKFLLFTLFVLFAAFESIVAQWSSGTSGNWSSWPNYQGNYNNSAPFRPHSTPPPYRPSDTRDSDSWLTHNYPTPRYDGYRGNSTGYHPSWPGYRQGESNGRGETWPPRSNIGQHSNSTRLYPSLAYFQTRPVTPQNDPTRPFQRVPQPHENSNYQNGRRYRSVR